MSLSSSSSYCLFCAEECPPTYMIINGDVHKLKHETGEILILETPGTVSTAEEINSIRSNLEVIFILREIFNYPSEKCVPYLSERGGQMHPEYWFTVCSTCRPCLQEYCGIQRNVTQLEKKLVEMKSKLKESIFRSSKKKLARKARFNVTIQQDNIWNDLRNHALQEYHVAGYDNDMNNTSCILPEASAEPVNVPGTAFPVEDYPDACENYVSGTPSPVSPNNGSDSDWCPDLNEANVKVTEKAKNLHKSTMRQNRKRLSQTTPRSRLKRFKLKRMTKRKTEDLNSLEIVSPHDTLKDTSISIGNNVKQHCGAKPGKPKKKPPKRRCDECPATFKSLPYLAEHKRSVHTKDSGMEFKCPECGKIFDISHKLLSHLNSAHNSKGSDVKWFRNGSGFKKFVNKTGIPYYCDHCDIVLWSRQRLVHHVKDHHGNRRDAACQYCEEKLESKQLLQFHLEVDHPGVSEVFNAVPPNTEETPQSCLHCSELFPTKMELDYHIATIHKHTCPECGHIVAGHPQLKSHLMAVHGIGERPVVCELCSKRYADIKGLHWHRQVEHYKELGLTPFICTICGLVAPAEIYLTAHIRNVHEKVKSHFCEFCGKGFAFSGDLQRHILIHTAPKEERYKKGPFFCQFCNAKFNVRQGLYYHLKRKHNDTFSFRCDNCGKGYCTSIKLKQHKKSCVKKVDT